MLSLAVGSCLPKTGALNRIAVINGPEETKVWGLSGELERALKRQLISGRVRFAPLLGVRQQESIRDIRGNRAYLEAALLAKDMGAQYGVLVSAPIYERTALLYKEFATVHRSVTSRVQLQAIVINADNVKSTKTYFSEVYTSTRTEFAHDNLPNERNDPDLARLREQALNDIAQALAPNLITLVE